MSIRSICSYWCLALFVIPIPFFTAQAEQVVTLADTGVAVLDCRALQH